MQPPYGDSPLHYAAWLVEDGILVTDGVQVAFVNAALRRMLGYSSATPLDGAPLHTLVAEDAWQDAVSRASSTPSSQWLDIRMTHQSGGDMTLRLHLNRHASSGAWVALFRLADEVMPTRANDEQLLATLDAHQEAIANDLHDALGTDLAAVALMLAQIEDQMAPVHRLRSRITLVRKRIHAAAQKTRRISRGMQVLRDIPGVLVHAMEHLVVDWQQLRGLHCDLLVDGNFDHVPAATGTHIYRIAQEAIHNAVRHGRATAMRIWLAAPPAPGPLQMVIEDNGRGLHLPLSPEHLGSGSGIRSARARARLIHGTVTYDHGPLGGWRVTVRWPRPADATDRA